MSHFDEILFAYIIAFSSLTGLIVLTVFKHFRMKKRMQRLSRVLERMQADR